MKIWTAVLRLKHFINSLYVIVIFYFYRTAAYCLLPKLNISTVRLVHILLIKMNILVVIFAYSDCPEHYTSIYVAKYQKCLNSYFY